MAPKVPTESRVARVKPCPLTGLPGDVFDSIARCLVGWDLLQLACVNGHLYRDLLADPTIWATRVQQHQLQVEWRLKDAKRQYATLSSFQFGGQSVEDLEKGDRGACIEALRFLPSWNDRLGQLFIPLAPRQFSFDVWFSTSSVDAVTKKNAFYGGVILGAQSARWQDSMVWADYHAQFIHVDPQRKLYCTVIGDKTPVGILNSQQWYHLALVFGVNEERVYLNGELVRRTAGSLHRDWRSLYFMQVGTGCTDPSSVGSPSTTYSGWYPFHGIVDDFRIWEEALTASDIAALASDTLISQTPLGSIKACHKSTHLGDVQRARCSRPREGACVVWK